MDEALFVALLEVACVLSDFIVFTVLCDTVGYLFAALFNSRIESKEVEEERKKK